MLNRTLLMVVWMSLAAYVNFASELMRDKTLVAWVTMANLDQRGGSVFTVQKNDGVNFDGIVLGEISPGKWMAGSDLFKRTRQDQTNVPSETATNTLVQVAVVYQGRQITIYRDGLGLTTYEVAEPEGFGRDSTVLIGLRHTGAAPPNRYFIGSIEDARLYDVPLSADEIANLKPNQRSEPQPLAWWDFEEGIVSDRMQIYRSTTMVGGARIKEGRLWLDEAGAYLLASTEDPGAEREPAASVTRQLREHLLSDPHRPGYHFVIPEGLAMPFDPNGAIFWKGRYHLFYIFQDKRGHNWGHVSSKDLFHWRHHPTGLTSGMFSGNCFINAEGRPTICYHEVGQGNAMAVALDDELNEWQKLPTNPITPRTAPGDPHHDRYRSWDPFGWYEGSTYYAIFGGERPAVAKAPSLAGEWKYVGDLMANSVKGVAINEDVSCADFFRLGDRYMLLCISHRLGCRYYLGEWKGEQFHPQFHEKMSWADNSFFAPESLVDDRGRRIMWAWIFDYPEFQMRSNFGWSGTLSLPRVLSLNEEGQLRMDVPDEIEALRYNAQHRTNLVLASDSQLKLEGVSGESLELEIEFNPSSARQIGVKVRCAPDASEETVVYYDSEDKMLKIDTTKSSLAGGPKTLEAGPLLLEPGEALRLRVFLDRSVVEAFANSRQAVMRRVYPSRPESVGVALFTSGGAAKVKRFSAYEMMPSNPY